eukprot:1157868-Pelagomonas_calceolata.AAC.5
MVAIASGLGKDYEEETCMRMLLCHRLLAWAACGYGYAQVVGMGGLSWMSCQAEAARYYLLLDKRSIGRKSAKQSDTTALSDATLAARGN